MKMQNIKVVFLDIDGVLNNAVHLVHSTKHMCLEWDPNCISNLKRILDTTSAKIVVCSSWRAGQDLESLTSLFELYGLGKYILGFTPFLGWENDDDKQITTWFKIIDDPVKYDLIYDFVKKEFLGENERFHVESFVVLDDDISYKTAKDKGWKKNLIRINRDYGIRRKDADMAIEILGKSKEPHQHIFNSISQRMLKNINKVKEMKLLKSQD